MFRRLTILALAILFVVGMATEADALYGLKKYWFAVYDEQGEIITSGTDDIDILVYDAGTTTKATIYSDDVATSKSQTSAWHPTSSGLAEFYSAASTVDVTVANDNYSVLKSGLTVLEHRITIINDTSIVGLLSLKKIVFPDHALSSDRERGTYIKIDDRDIGLATPSDVTGAKLDFIYATEPTVTGGGKNVVGVDIWMRMDYDYTFNSANRNADVRAARIQTELRGSLGGMLEGIYANAKTNIAANETITAEHTTGAYGVGMCAIQARTEINGAGTLTVPHIAGVYILSRRMGAGGVTGDYHAIHIENSQSTGAISGVETGIHFEPNTMAPPGANFDYGIDFGSVTIDYAEIVMQSTVANQRTVIASGSATDDAGIVTDVGSDATICDGSLYIEANDGAGSLWMKVNDTWTELTWN